MDDTPQCVYSMPAVNWQPAMFKCGRHHGRIAGPRKASSAAAGGCMPGEHLTCLTEDVCIEHPCPKTQSTQHLAGIHDECSVGCIWTLYLELVLQAECRPSQRQHGMKAFV